ncbi:HD domain-containing phosphohydrolase [Oleidesulfovibrio sp.]|uniref:HD domain-containing phosphohydrolase n=1 Tax=Oleidesulfovibrio sp. TaxID=2909707 RepID=UPI003A8BE81E
MTDQSIAILVIDDDPVILRNIGCYLEDSGFIFLSAIDGASGIAIFEEERPDAVVVDLNMPGMNGLDVISRISAQSPTTPIIVVSGTGIIDEAVGSMKCGAWNFLSKPIREMQNLEDAINSGLRRAQSMRESAEYKETLERMVKRRTRELQLANDRTEAILIATVKSLSTVINMKDAYTGTHQHRVAIIAPAIAQELGMDHNGLEAVRLAALLHDVGKMGLPSEFLTKPSALDANEMMFIRQHPQMGYDILKDVPFELPIPEMVLQHHERLDGSGYPHGLSGDAILPEARILAVADTVEAICSHRPWRPAHPFDYARKMLTEKKGSAFCPECVDTCLKLIERRDPRLTMFIATIEGL